YLHVVIDDLLGGSGNRHHAGRALPIDRHAGHRVRQPGPQCRLTGDVEPLGALLQRGTDHHVFHFRWRDTGAPDRFGDDMAPQRLRLRIVECAAIGSADRRASRGDDDGTAHGTLLPKAAPPIWTRPRSVVDGTSPSARGTSPAPLPASTERGVRMPSTNKTPSASVTSPARLRPTARARCSRVLEWLHHASRFPYALDLAHTHCRLAAARRPAAVHPPSVRPRAWCRAGRLRAGGGASRGNGGPPRR